jgi:hypothetical protein
LPEAETTAKCGLPKDRVDEIHHFGPQLARRARDHEGQFSGESSQRQPRSPVQDWARGTRSRRGITLYSRSGVIANRPSPARGSECRWSAGSAAGRVLAIRGGLRGGAQEAGGSHYNLAHRVGVPTDMFGGWLVQTKQRPTHLGETESQFVTPREIRVGGGSRRRTPTSILSGHRKGGQADQRG